MDENRTSRSAKRAARNEARGRVVAMGREARAAADRAICDRLVELPSWRTARAVLLYHALGDEVNVGRAIEAALSADKEVYLPRVTGSQLVFRRLVDLAALERLARHRYGMLEPAETEPGWDHARGSASALVVCPGRAFDAQGTRLGRGAGFYDRFLTMLTESPASPVVTIVGVCYETQFVPELPRSPNDHPVELLVTEARTIGFADDQGRGASV